MEYVLYVDVLFLVNFSMDYVTLYLTSSLLHLRKKVLRMLFASAIGALGAVILTVSIRSSLLYSVLGAVLCAAMTYTAYGSAPLKIFIIRTAAVWGSGAFIGGAVTAVSSLGSGMGKILPRVIIGGITAAVAASRFAVSTPDSAELEISLCGRTLTVTAMTDSGNLLREPISGRPVILLSDSVAARLMGPSSLNLSEEKLPVELARRLRLIPYKTVEGSGVLRGFLPDKVCVEGSERDAVFAVERGGSYGGYEALVPARLARRSAPKRKSEGINIHTAAERITSGRCKKQYADAKKGNHTA